MCGPAEDYALWVSLTRLGALSLASGGLFAFPWMARIFEELRRRERREEIRREGEPADRPTP